MQSHDLTREQCERLAASVGRQLRFLNQVLKRMDAEHFRPDDPLRKKFTAARDAIHSLSVDLHYRSCPGGIGEAARRVGRN